MSETDEIQSESGLTKGPEEPVESTLGLGATLRAEREKRGMSLDQVVSVTKLRKQMIDALENEEWGKLPPPVFVRGFIRTYAKVLGVDEKNLLGLYERLMPEKEEPVVPLAPPQRSRKGWYLVAVLAVVLLGIVLLLWRQHAPSPRKRALPPTEAALGSTPKKENVPKEAQPVKKVEIPRECLADDARECLADDARECLADDARECLADDPGQCLANDAIPQRGTYHRGGFSDQGWPQERSGTAEGRGFRGAKHRCPGPRTRKGCLCAQSRCGGDNVGQNQCRRWRAERISSRPGLQDSMESTKRLCPSDRECRRN
jgi:transcriptional regulator with XRE-family HTH domain